MKSISTFFASTIMLVVCQRQSRLTLKEKDCMRFVKFRKKS